MDAHDSAAQDMLLSDEIYLRRYVATIFAWWREFMLIMVVMIVVGIGIALLLSLLASPRYEASADVIMARVVSSVNLVESFRTTTDDPNSSARRETLVNLVKSGTIAEAVIAELGDLLNETEKNPGTLIQMVSAEAPTGSDGRTISDLIRITVRIDNPQKAEAIANAWARQYVSHINSVYNQVPIEIFESVGEELQKANAEYVTAQQALEAFIAENPIDELTNQIDQKIALRSNYQEAQKALVISIAEQDRAARNKVFTDLVATQTNGVYQVFNSQAQAQLDNLSQLYKTRNLARRQLVQAQNLRHQAEADADIQTVGTGLALQLLKTQVYATIEGSTLPGGLTIDLGTVLTQEAPEPLPDIEALIDTLQDYLAQLDDQIDALSEQLLTGNGYAFVDRYKPEHLTISAPITTETAISVTGRQNELADAIYARYLDLFQVGELARLSEAELSGESSTGMSLMIKNMTQEIQALQAELAAAQSKQLLLTQQHDQTWNTFNTLSDKVVELRLARTAANTEVRFGSPAIAPSKPVAGVSLIYVSAIAGALGVMLAILTVTLAHLMNWRPWLSRVQSQQAT
jgi:uncharacterized protein involved in exopolysaccharide biosynthesis